jgi:hypothetical protein
MPPELRGQDSRHLQLPPPVLASLLGVHITTALAWSHRAQRDWSAYLANRATEQGRQAASPSLATSLAGRNMTSPNT